ncbi:MAG: hypothetical protein AB7S26_05905 [Sandaracinaceae bacterium]
MEDEALKDAISAYSSGPTIIRANTEEELTEQLQIMLERSYAAESELEVAYYDYLERNGEPVVMMASYSETDACVASAAASGAAAGAVIGELVVDACRVVAWRFSWSPWGWATALVCVAIDKTDLDRVIGSAVGRALGGAFAQCAAVPEGIVGQDDVPVLAEEGDEVDERPVDETASLPHPRVMECTNAQIADLCGPGPGGRQLIGEIYHSADACGAQTDEQRLYQFTDCEAAITGIYGELSPDPNTLCWNAATIAERAARCQRGREIGGYGCFDAPNAGHQTAIDRARDLNVSCRNLLTAQCPETDSDASRFRPSGHDNYYCPQAMM